MYLPKGFGVGVGVVTVVGVGVVTGKGLGVVSTGVVSVSGADPAGADVPLSNIDTFGVRNLSEDMPMFLLEKVAKSAKATITPKDKNIFFIFKAWRIYVLLQSRVPFYFKFKCSFCPQKPPTCTRRPAA